MRCATPVCRYDRFTDSHLLGIVCIPLPAIETHHVAFTLGDAMLPDRCHRPAQVSMVATQQQVEDRLDHRIHSTG